MIRALLLPGLDGTGTMLRGFASALAPGIDADIAAYPSHKVLDYAGLATGAQRFLPGSGRCLLIAESFSGPVAIRLAHAVPERISGIVLCASFAKAPRGPGLWDSATRMGRVVSHFPLPVRWMPVTWMSPFMMGRWSTAQWRNHLRVAIREVSSDVARHRVLAALDVDDSALLKTLTMPILYLRASDDRIVSDASWLAIRAARPDADIVTIEGPHFLLQANPAACATAIVDWAARMNG